ncbi:unnamed protein product, partial [Nesidiocoris tenuis]
MGGRQLNRNHLNRQISIVNRTVNLMNKIEGGRDFIQNPNEEKRLRTDWSAITCPSAKTPFSQTGKGRSRRALCRKAEKLRSTRDATNRVSLDEKDQERKEHGTEVIRGLGPRIGVSSVPDISNESREARGSFANVLQQFGEESCVAGNRNSVDKLKGDSGS